MSFKNVGYGSGEEVNERTAEDVYRNGQGWR